ncbi:hypothetical protein Bdt_1201 [Bdellovibrio bacteriovorus str. Tiberius]|uniref:Uncharacterized protein n=2 Tax=Bdellovibrio bacteriovorus TaxID=959 RepID=K7YW34_BDEBC|nr:hypothetical protein Bdt_1201 [Bdellovibrio bacteriovorus str. Tiberius]
MSTFISGCSLNAELMEPSKVVQAPSSVRLPAVGAPDLSFGGSGFVQHKINMAVDLSSSINNLVVDASGKIYLAGTTNYQLEIMSMNADGSVNTSFGSQGYFRSRTPTYGEDSQMVLFNQSGVDYIQLVSTYIDYTTFGNRLLVSRLTSQGSAVNSFGTNGEVNIAMPDNTVLKNILRHSDGSFSIVFMYDRWPSQIRILKLTANGAVDASYGDNGQAIHMESPDDHDYLASTVDSSGRVVVLARDLTGDYINKIWRTTTTGLADTSFNTTGMVTLNSVTPQAFVTIVTDTSNRILIAGDRTNATKAVAYRFTEAGALDTAGFNSPNGFVQYEGSADRTFVSAATLGAAGSYRLLGQRTSKFEEWSISSAGVITLASNPATQASLTLPAQYEQNTPYIHSITVSATNEIYVLRRSDATIYFGDLRSHTDSLIHKILPNGQPDPSFNSGTLRILNDRPIREVASFKGLTTTDSAGNIYAINDLELGYDGIGISIHRYKPNGQLDSSYGTGGYVLVPDVKALYAQITSTGKLLMRTKKFTSGSGWSSGFLQLTPSGAFDNDFGTAGARFLSLPADHFIMYPGTDQKYPMTITKSGDILTMVVFRDDNLGQDYIAIWKVDASGNTVTTFGAQGLLQLPAADVWSVSRLIETEGDYLYLQSDIRDNDWKPHVALARVSLSTGLVDTAFGGSTMWKNLDIAGGTDTFQNTELGAVDSKNRLIVAAYYITPDSIHGDPNRMLVQRFNLDGSPDTSFNAGNPWEFEADPTITSEIFASISTDIDDKVFIGTNRSLIDPTVVRVNTVTALKENGELDTSFGTGGTYNLTPLINSSDTSAAIVGQSWTPSGKLVISVNGYEHPSTGRSWDMLLTLK